MTDLALIEDSDNFNDLFEIMIQDPHKIVASAKNKKEGLELARQIANGEILVDALALDGAHSKGLYTVQDAIDVLQILSTMEHPPIIFGISGLNNDYVIEENRFPKQGIGGKGFDMKGFIKKLDEIQAAKLEL